MAYVNVAEWKTNQVCEWLKGLDNAVLPYVHSFMNHNVNGQQLLSLRPEDLEQLGVFKLGHQEIILEAVEYLRTFHYDLDRENLQLLAMRLSGQAHSLYNELSRQSDLSKPVATQTLSDVVGIITAVKPLIRWLDRPPFSGHLEYNDKKAELLKLSLEMATCAQRDRFAEKPMEEIRSTCGQMAKLADYIIQDVADPMILQPASLDLATLKKKPGDDLGFCILPSFHGAHQVAEIKFGSAAHQCGKMEESDEIVQVNYQTVVGWERKNVLELFRESPADVLLTLKRRPRHTKVYGQIYIKPYRLPSNKKTPYSTRWEHSLPSPRPELLTIPDFVMPLPKHPKKLAATPKPASILDTVSMLDTMTTDDSGSSAGEESDDGSECGSRSAVRLYSAKPRNLVQRRATITGASPTAKHSRVNIEHIWRELKREHSTLSFQLCEKAVSCAHGLNNETSCSQAQSVARPQTCLGIEQRSASGETRKVKFQDGDTAESGHDRASLPISSTTNDGRQEADDSSNNLKTHAAAISSTENNKEKSNEILHSKDCQQQDIRNITHDNKEEAPALRVRVLTTTKERGRFDKSYSTPAYDLTESDDDFIERKFEAALDEHHKQQLRARAAAGKSDSLNKTDSRLFDSVEDLEEHDRTTLTKRNLDDPSLDSNMIIGNVARKISDIEKNLHNRSNEKISEKNFSKSSLNIINPIKSNIHIKVNDVDVSDHLDELEADSGNITTDFDSDDESNFFSSDTYDTKPEIKCDANIEITGDNSVESSREGSEDKSESTSSYIEANTSNSSSSADGEGKKCRSDIVETIDSALLEKTRQIEQGESIDARESVQQDIRPAPRNHDTASQHDGMIKALSPNIQVHKNALVENISTKYPTTPTLNNQVPSPVRPETPRREAHTKPEVKPRLMPPEPPPRKYFTKPTPLTINVNQHHQPINQSPRDQHLQHPERPKVPERPSVRRDLKKNDPVPEVHPRSEHPLGVYPRNDNSALDQHHKTERLETYTDFVEKSTDFIDEPGTPRQREFNKASNSLVDPYGYTEIPEEPGPSLQPFTPTNCSSPNEHSRYDYGFQNIDIADGLCHSRQNSQSIESKPRSLEKDKSHERGVVNRAMMVARSIGLHGNSTKASNSPRSVRKQTTNLAKRRNVAVKDVSPGDLEGWLIYRSRGAGGAWDRAWFVIKGASLYRFKTQDSTKAECLIALSGFTASQATEVKSRKYAFKVYYTGTVFYFAADTEDTLALWLDAINRATLGAERISGLFSETDESDGESKNKAKNSSESKPLTEKTFNSLKKLTKKESSVKDHEITGASLDRKYLKFLGSRTQNVPVPTAQFRSYRRVLPTSPPNKKPEKLSSSDLQVTIAGSTFYGLNSSQSATNVLNSPQDMGDYRRTTERLKSNRNQRPEELQGFITLEEFMLARQEEECQRSNSNSFNNDQIHIQHRNIVEGLHNVVSSNGMIYGSPRNGEEMMSSPTEQAPPTPTCSELIAASNRSFDGSESGNSSKTDSVKSKSHKKSWEPSCLQKKKSSSNNNFESCHTYSPTATCREFSPPQTNVMIDNRGQGHSTFDYGERLKPQARYRVMDSCNANVDFPQSARRVLRSDGYSSSNSDLACQVCLETTQHPRKEMGLGCNNSFNLIDCRRPDHAHLEDNWSLEIPRPNDNAKTGDGRNSPMRKVGQYSSTSIPASPLHQEAIRAAFEIHHELQQHQQPASPKKSKGLRNFFSKSSPKGNNHDNSKEPTQKKTLLGSPSLRRAFFRDKPRNRSTNQNPGDSEVPQSHYAATSHAFYSNYNTVNYVSNNMDQSQMLPSQKHAIDEPYAPQANQSHRYYIPAQWPSSSANTNLQIQHLDYPPTFEPETYTFSNPSLRRQRSTKNNEDHDTCQ